MRKIWDILYPLLFYYAVMLITMTIAQWIFGSDNSQYVLCRLLSTVVTIPFVLPFYRSDQALAGKAPEKFALSRALARNVICIVAIVACISVALNNLITMTPLVELSAGYQEANAGFYGSTLVPELISSALFTPVLEELVFRGILYGRLQKMLPKAAAIVCSALLFAVVHWNIVQFLYALFLGLVLTLLLERTGSLYAAVLGHITANFIAVIRTETGFLSRTVQGDAFSWIVSAVFLAAGVISLFIWREKYDNRRDLRR